MRRGKNLWKQSHDSWGGSMCEACLFCIYPLSAAVCTVLFPRTPEHSRRPPSNPEPQHRGPTSTFAKETLSVLSSSLAITCVCWIWAAEKTRCRSEDLRVNHSDNRCANFSSVLRAVWGWFPEKRTRLLCISRLSGFCYGTRKAVVPQAWIRLFGNKGRTSCRLFTFKLFRHWRSSLPVWKSVGC